MTPSLDHSKLGKRNGAKYLLKYLQERLCRTATPDAGARLEDLLIRLCRPLGMAMSHWANEVLEGYRKVQRAVIRARQLQRSKDKEDVKSVLEPHQEPPTSPSRRTPASSPTHRTTPSPTRRTAGYGAEPQAPTQESEDEQGDYAAVHRLMKNGKIGASSDARTGMMTTPVLVKTFLGMSCKQKRFRSCPTRCWVGCYSGGPT